MRTSKSGFWLSVIGGVLMVVVGVIFLLGNLGIISPNWDIIIGPLFGIGGLVLLLIFVMNTDNWWVLFPGFILIAIAIIVFMDETVGVSADQWSGAVFLGLLSLAFFIIYLVHREHWWAIIPGGVLLTLAGVTVLPDNNYTAGLFFLGLALTFGLIYLLPKPGEKSKWALYPAAILLFIGGLVTLSEAKILGYVWPAVLLIAGGVIIFRTLKK